MNENESSNEMMDLAKAIIKKARAEAFLDAIQIYLEFERFPDKGVLLALASQGMIVPDAPTEVADDGK